MRPGRFSCSVPRATRFFESVWVKLAVIDWTADRCCSTLAMSPDCAWAGAAMATMATGARARARFVGKLIFYGTPGYFPPCWQFAIECGLNLPVPYRSACEASERVPVGVDQHFAAADMVRLANQAFLLHPLDQASGAVVAYAQLAL